MKTAFSMRLMACALLLSASAALAAGHKPAAAHHTKLMPYVEIPVEHGVWGPLTTPCGKISNVDILRFDPQVPVESKFLDCAPGMKQTGPNTYQDVLCQAPNAEAPSTYVVQSRTRMTIDGEPYHFCPNDQVNPVYRN